MHSSPVFTVLKNANFRNLWLSQLISQIFLNTLVFSQLLRVYDLTHSNAAVSVLILMVGLPNLLLGALAGVLVDRWSRKQVMFFAQFLRVLAILLFILSPESVLWIYVLMFIIASITQFWDPAERTTIPQIIKGPLLLTANSIYTLTFFTTVIFGNILAGPLLAWFGSFNGYLVIASAFLISSLFIIKLPGESPLTVIYALFSSKSKEFSKDLFSESLFSDLRNEFKEGLAFLRENRAVRNSIIFLATSQTLIASLSVLAPGFARKVVHIPTTDVSLLVMLPAALGMVVGAILVGQLFLKVDRKLLINLGLFACSLSLLAISQIPKLFRLTHVPLHLLGFALLIFLGFSNALLDVPANTLIQEKTNPSIRSRVYGLLTAIVGAAAIFPIIIVGSLSDIFGIGQVIALIGFFVLILAVINYERKKESL